MKITGIIAEYNPFHNGHAYQIRAAGENGATHIVCAMSGNFTQRGDVAIMDKIARTRCALANGADLVLELPVAYALGNAGIFAKGGIETLLATGCLDALHFGSECGDTEPLRRTAAAIEHLEAVGAVDKKQGVQMRRQALLDNGYAAEAALMDTPNNLLAVEYMLALRSAYSHVLPETVKRAGTQHDSRLVADEFCSASQLRRIIQADPAVAEGYAPKETLDILADCKLNGRAPVTLSALDRAILSRLRMVEPAYLARIAGVSEGLENRLYEAIRQGRSFDEICNAVKTKRYPLSRIRRILLCAAIGITAKDQEGSPAYIRVLGQNQRGNEILRVMRQTAKLPVILRTSDMATVSERGKRLFRLENLATDLYTMAYEPMGTCGMEYTANLYRFTKGDGYEQ